MCLFIAWIRYLHFKWHFLDFMWLFEKRSIYNIDFPSHAITGKGISWQSHSLLRSIEHSTASTALLVVWEKSLITLRQIFLLQHTRPSSPSKQGTRLHPAGCKSRIHSQVVKHPLQFHVRAAKKKKRGERERRAGKILKGGRGGEKSTALLDLSFSALWRSRGFLS